MFSNPYSAIDNNRLLNTAAFQREALAASNPAPNTCLLHRSAFSFSLRFAFFRLLLHFTIHDFFAFFHSIARWAHSRSPLKMNEVMCCSPLVEKHTKHHIPDPILKSKVFFPRLLFVRLLHREHWELSMGMKLTSFVAEEQMVRNLQRRAEALTVEQLKEINAQWEDKKSLRLKRHWWSAWNGFTTP